MNRMTPALLILTAAALLLPARAATADEPPAPADTERPAPPMPSLLELPRRLVSDVREAARIPRRMDGRDWTRFGLGAGAVGLLCVYDEDIRDDWKKRRDDFYDDFKPLGDKVYAVGFFLASYLAGWMTGHRGLAETGCAGLEALILTGIPVVLIQGMTGRERPDDGGSYKWFSFHDGHGASGHAAVAFCSVTVLDRRYLGVEPDMTGSQKFWRYAGKLLLYGAAACTALERINDDKHFASDVAIGGALGFLCANFVMNRRPEIGFAVDGDTAMVYFVKDF